MKLWLIRHGQTLANERHLYCGSTDLSLSAVGLETLKKLHYTVKAVFFVTSGMKRTDETLQILFGDIPHRTEPRLREMDFGDFEMQSYEKLKNDPAYQTWITGDNESNVTPNGESGRLMQTRVLEALEEILQSQRDTVIITHGGPIAAIMAHLFPGEGKNRYEWQPKPGCGYEIRLEPNLRYDILTCEET